MESHGRHNRETFLWLPDIAQEIAFRLNTEINKEKLVAFRVSEMSPGIQCYLYRQGDHVTPHYDDSQQVKDGRWSAFTLVIYLNDGFTGGATAFPELGIELSAPRGHGVLFKQSLLHEGKRVLTGEKYIARTVAATVC
jgi:prolyl 4-hydroxylase